MFVKEIFLFSFCKAGTVFLSLKKDMYLGWDNNSMFILKQEFFIFMMEKLVCLLLCVCGMLWFSSSGIFAYLNIG
ncbi:hypothetical protein RH08_00555 [Candidatus Liberibacter asiaticus]|uniref:Uncharacterized protein n=2 Tax=Liberibacter asiaticus TaxID=34021 RepID=C6XHG5_LIBAP|nr:hypothetical protein CLIBASIA_00600 [Candidatus Liberibacter asiaticus str. psy62]AGH16475.1 hypothetical protein WSI_00515 [Candidatus Liberibacter asiaticus str. gxpsy]ALK06877.1 hypothetical protein CD16_00520 [Candidatus Liberibacter asiaticus]BAP25994.1 hypothetical protein CGUJ_00600 [Candidatus Liberibacter asiaticus str. Ishi-1]ASK52350.1 hypothetical protein B2I23_00550 [Candidatus Liberibacter asiaticus]